MLSVGCAAHFQKHTQPQFINILLKFNGSNLKTKERKEKTKKTKHILHEGSSTKSIEQHFEKKTNSNQFDNFWPIQKQKKNPFEEKLKLTNDNRKFEKKENKFAA